MTLDQFMPHLLIALPGCPDPLIRQALLAAGEEFCRRTHSWVESLDPIPLQPGVREYELDAPVGGAAMTVLEARVGGVELMPLPTDQRQLRMSGWEMTSGSPLYFNMEVDRQSISVYPLPDGTEQLYVRASFTPTPTANSLPDYLGWRYLSAITGHVKSALMAVPGKMWTNTELVPYHRQQFEDGVSEAHSEMLHGGSLGPVVARPRRFGSW